MIQLCIRRTVLVLLAAMAGPIPRANAAECSAASVSRAFAGDEFRVILAVADIPPGVIDTFWRAYGATDPDHRIANPREPFQATDVIQRPALPWRRLVFAGVSPQAAYIYYEKGGRGLSRHLFVACRGASAPAFSHLNLRPADTFAGVLDQLSEECLITPPRESVSAADRARCKPRPLP